VGSVLWEGCALGEGSRAQTVLLVQPALAAAGGKQASNMSHGLCRECHKDMACRVTGYVSTTGKWPGRWFLSCHTILVQCLAVGMQQPLCQSLKVQRISCRTSSRRLTFRRPAHPLRDSSSITASAAAQIVAVFLVVRSPWPKHMFGDQQLHCLRPHAQAAGSTSQTQHFKATQCSTGCGRCTGCSPPISPQAWIWWTA
jgi:hypothetical protein